MIRKTKVNTNSKKVAKRFGVGVELAVESREGDRCEIRSFRLQQFHVKPAQQPRGKLLATSKPAVMARLLAGFSHGDRIRIARAIMTGASSHQQLADAVGLKTGPLYHHLNALERAGIVENVGRSQYSLTESGGAALLVVTALGCIAEVGPKAWIRRTERFVAKRNKPIRKVFAVERVAKRWRAG